MNKILKEENKAKLAEAKEEMVEAAGKAAKAAKKTVETAGEKVKGAARKTEELKSEAKTAISRAAARKPLKETVYLQYAGKEIDKDIILKRVKEVWTKEMKRKVGEMHTLTLYLKPEENKAYFVVNGDITGSVTLDPPGTAD